MVRLVLWENWCQFQMKPDTIFILVPFRSKTHCSVLYVAAVRKFLLFSSQLAVRGIPFNLSSQEDIILPVTGTPSFFVGVDFSAEDNSIFFSDTAKDIIFKQKVDGTGKTAECCFKIDVTSNILPIKIVVEYTHAHNCAHNLPIIWFIVIKLCYGCESNFDSGQFNSISVSLLWENHGYSSQGHRTSRHD